jgi:hypothetical protein
VEKAKEEINNAAGADGSDSKNAVPKINEIIDRFLNDHAKDLGGDAEKKSQEIGKCKRQCNAKFSFWL